MKNVHFKVSRLLPAHWIGYNRQEMGCGARIEYFQMGVGACRANRLIHEHSPKIAD